MLLKLWVSTSEGDDLDLFRGPSKGRFHRCGGLLLRVERLRTRWCRQRMAPSFTSGAGPIAQYTAASMAQPYSHTEATSRRGCTAGKRNLAGPDILRVAPSPEG